VSTELLTLQQSGSKIAPIEGTLINPYGGNRHENYFFCFLAAICLIAGGAIFTVQAKDQINPKTKGGKAMEIKSTSFNHEEYDSGKIYLRRAEYFPAAFLEQSTGKNKKISR